MTTPSIASLSNITLGEAFAYLDAADDNELAAALLLAHDRSHLSGQAEEPDDAEVHHALFLLRRVRGLPAPSYDAMRVTLRHAMVA